MDNGIGLQYTESKLDPKTKASKIWIGNRYGGWSMAILISIPHAKSIEARVKGPAPSFVYIEELTNCESVKYYSYLRAQLVRRRGMGTPPRPTASSPLPGGTSCGISVSVALIMAARVTLKALIRRRSPTTSGSAGSPCRSKSSRWRWR